MKRKFLIIALSLTLLGTGFTFAGWQSQVAKGNQAMQSGNAESAVTTYQEALIDAPDEPVIHYNLANALYQQGDYTGAKEHFTRTLESANTRLTQQAEYNLGNTVYREGTGLTQSNPQEAITHFEEALQHFQNVMKADPTDQDAKFNYEFVKKKLEELKDQLENQEQKDQSNDNGQEEHEDQNGDQKQDDQNGQEDNEGQQNRQSQQDSQNENQQDQDGEQDQQQSNEAQQSGTEEESSGNQQTAGAEEGEEGEELQGLTQAQALQLLEQFKDQVGEWIPVPMENDDNQRSGKDW